MKVKAKRNTYCLIENEWYEVIEERKSFDKSLNLYKIKNHTYKMWMSNWFNSDKFVPTEEIREEKLNKIFK